ncbi:hypothetical protein MBRA1_002493 [Malassezia brasiliensis]|uniref:PinX1-related protein 1 n=1 Tax=Malassezia brasiliensis TaxID=1821822 RepID=A0AAF0DUC8_9BASI|nr:hypothetical protein MBRA1_002493 [Malassezia brasiliensis]
MGLAEQRKKQRLVGSATTRNHAWLNDTSLPGQRLMASMGWAPGTGLGTSGQGMATNLTVAMKLDNKGIGAHRHEKEAREQNNPDAWISAGDDLGSLFERLNSANSPAPVSPASPASPATSAAVPPASMPAVSRLAHRAKFRRAKAMVSTDASRMNEILGISSAESSARNSPAPASESHASPTVSAAPMPAKRSRKDSEEDSSETSEPAVTKKSKKKGKKDPEDLTKAERKLQKAQAKEKRKREKREKREKKASAAQGAERTDEHTKDKSKKTKKASRASREDESESTNAEQPEAPTDTVMEESNFIVSPGGQFVFQYLSNKLMRRRAEVQLRRREAGKWW